MLRIAICEDQTDNAERLKTTLEEYSQQYDRSVSVKVFQSARELLRSDLDFDIFFLGMTLDEGHTGFELGERIRSKGIFTVLVYITSMSDTPLKESERHGLRILEEPFSTKALDNTMRACLKELEVIPNIIRIKNRVGGNHFVNQKQILLIESIDRIRRVYLIDGMIETWETLSSLYARLPEQQFSYIQKSHIVNLLQVTGVQPSKVELSNGSEYRLSPKFRVDFGEKLRHLTGEYPGPSYSELPEAAHF